MQADLHILFSHRHKQIDLLKKRLIYHFKKVSVKENTQISFTSKIPHFCGPENPTDFMLSKQIWEFLGSNLNSLTGHVIIQPFCCC